MNVLVVLNSQEQELRIVVNLHTKPLRRRVTELITQERSREALDLVVNRGMVQGYFPRGHKLPLTPDLTLIEDLL